jgi:hypothetical protein
MDPGQKLDYLDTCQFSSLPINFETHPVSAASTGDEPIRIRRLLRSAVSAD